MKKLLTIFCTFLLALSIATFGTNKSAEADTYIFPDVVYTKYADAVCFLHNNGIVYGTSNATYSPNRNVTRAEFVTMLYRMAGSPSVSDVINPFSDVKSGQYYYDAVLWAVSNGITAGTSATTFSPNKNVSYQEIFCFIHAFSYKIVKRYSAVNKKYNLGNPSNLSSYSDWARNNASWAYRNGIVYGVSSNNLFTPKDSATRGDVALFLYNYYRSFQKKFALVAANSSRTNGTWEYGPRNVGLMKQLFEKMKVDKLVSESNVGSRTNLNSLFETAFSNSTCIDICYLYLHSHGDGGGLILFSSSNEHLTPYQLYNQLIKDYDGFFVIMVEACYAGSFATYPKNHDIRHVSVITSSDNNHQANGYGNYGLATQKWAEYIESKVKTNRFVSLYDVQVGTRQQINDIYLQNPSFYSYQQDYVAFTKKFDK